MKKLLSLIGAIGLTTTSTSSLVACTITGKDQNKNPNFVPPDDVPLVEQKISIEQAVLARLRTVILDNEYQISDRAYRNYSLEQNAKDLTGLKRYQDKTMQDVYEEYFGSTSLNPKTVTYQNVSLKGRLGEKGDIFNLFLSGMKDKFLPENIIKILEPILKLLGFNNVVDKINDLIKNFAPNAVSASEKMIQILQSLNISTIAQGIPLGVNMLGGISLSSKELIAVQQAVKLLPSIIKQTSVDGFFNSLATGINFDFSTYMVSDLTSIFLIEMSNAVQAFTSDDYQPLTYTAESAVIESQLIKAGEFLGTSFMNSTTAKNPKIGSGMMAILKALSALSLKMTLLNSPTKNFVPLDENHLFSIQDNATYLSENLPINQKVSENPMISKQPTLAHYFNFGEFFSNLVYFFDNSLDERPIALRLLKFLNVLFADKVDSQKISSQTSLLLAGVLSKTNPQGGIGNDEGVIKKAAQTLNEVFTTSFLTNQAITPPTTTDPFATSLAAWLKTDSTFLNKPFDISYQGDLTTLLKADSFKKILGDTFWTNSMSVLTKIFNYQKDHHANIKNLLATQLINILTAAGAKNYSAADLQTQNGLFPNYAAYYTNKTPIQIINELKGIFGITGMEETTVLTYRYFDVQLFNQVIDQILYKVNGQEGLLTMLVNNLDYPDQILTNLGYVLDNQTKPDNFRYAIKNDSWMGQLLSAFAPDLIANQGKNGVIYLDEIIGQAKNYTDNFHAFAREVAEMMTQLIKPTDYKYWIKPIFDQKGAFWVDTYRSEWTIRQEDIYKGVIHLTFNPNGIVVLNDPNPKVILQSPSPIDYKVYFSRNTPGQQYTIYKIEKVLANS